MFGHYIKVSCLLLWKCNATLLLTGKCIDRLKNLFVYLGKKAQIPKKNVKGQSPAQGHISFTDTQALVLKPTHVPSCSPSITSRFGPRVQTKRWQIFGHLLLQKKGPVLSANTDQTAHAECYIICKFTKANSYISFVQRLIQIQPFTQLHQQTGLAFDRRSNDTSCKPVCLKHSEQFTLHYLQSLETMRPNSVISM